MAKVKAIKVGYHNHRRIKVGEIVDLPGIDDKGFYVDDKGAKVKGKDGKIKKCKWVDHVDTKADVPVDPKEIAAVLSGKNPGIKSQGPEEL